MPVCPHPSCNCEHRDLAVDALIQHVTSSPWAAKYYCSHCRCVCRSQIVLQAHMSKLHKYPATANAQLNIPGPSRPQSAPPARAAPTQQAKAVLPTRTVPAKVTPTPAFKPTAPAITAPETSRPLAQPQSTLTSQSIAVSVLPVSTVCASCRRTFPKMSALLQHYRDSAAHPKCSRCVLGFPDNAAIQTVGPNFHFDVHP
ncbi:hypothetical protein FA95DRAFT_936924 [Auriscalpium vulgare]|uniref:Uncharacterized protein n=1 Tax=Auriscalpium vulgare TaxID=40419 RepID=A0ACB8SAE9_9AGAM|nr:hypothetical protein FA95DRAFT_936924 [Auriscalpium vulgare]